MIEIALSIIIVVNVISITMYNVIVKIHMFNYNVVVNNHTIILTNAETTRSRFIKTLK